LSVVIICIGEYSNISLAEEKQNTIHCLSC